MNDHNFKPKAFAITAKRCVEIAKIETGATLHVRTIHRACGTGKISAARFGRSWAINEASFREWLKGYPHTGKFWKERRKQKREAKKSGNGENPYRKGLPRRLT